MYHLSQMANYLISPHQSTQVPVSAWAIHTPLRHSNWAAALKDYGHQPMVEFFLSRISHGFQVGFDYTQGSLKSASKNLNCALQHKQVVNEYLENELHDNRIFGPFQKADAKGIHINRFGVIPKHHQSDKLRLIVDLSFLNGRIVNDRILKTLCSLSYNTVDTAIDEICRVGPNCLLAKIDVKSTFRLLPVHHADQHLLGMEWKKLSYVDNCLPFGLLSAPKLFNILAQLLLWIVNSKGISFSIHYLDNFLTLDPPAFSTCQQNLDIFRNTCAELLS